MIITEFDAPLTAEDARKISINNRDDGLDRARFRECMSEIKEHSSWGYTRWVSATRPRSLMPSEHCQAALRSLGYKVTEKRAYKWDEEKKEFSKEVPLLDSCGREQFFLEITWG